MSRNRFEEFQNAASRRPPTMGPPPDNFRFGNQMEMGAVGGQTPPLPPPYGGGRGGGRGGGPPGMSMNDGNNPSAIFFEKLASTRDLVQEIRTTLSQIDYLHRKHLDSMTDAQSQQTQNQLDALISDTTKSANTARTKIKELNQLIPKMDQVEAETARTQLQAIKTKFMDTMTEFQEIERKYRNQMRGRLERQYRIVKPDATPQEVDNMLSQDQPSQLFAQSVLQSNPYGQAREALREVQERHEDIRKIEKTILELHQLFQDMAMLVEAQSEQVNNIVTHVENAEQYTEQANNEVGKAIEIRKRTRKKLWCLLFLGIILLAIIGVIVYTQVIAPGLAAANATSGGGGNDNQENIADNRDDGTDAGGQD